MGLERRRVHDSAHSAAFPAVMNRLYSVTSTFIYQILFTTAFFHRPPTDNIERSLAVFDRKNPTTQPWRSQPLPFWPQLRLDRPRSSLENKKYKTQVNNRERGAEHKLRERLARQEQLATGHLLWGGTTKVLRGRHVAEHVLDRDSNRAAGEAAARGRDDGQRRRIESGWTDDPSVV